MSPALARRRAAKAVRRKALAKERRRDEGAAESLAARARRAATGAIRGCLLQTSLAESGMGVLLVGRDAAAGEVAIAGFLIDGYSLGVKDAFLQNVPAGSFANAVAMIGQTAPLEPVAPSYARKLLHDAVAYARSLGFGPHPDYAAIEPIFGTIRADDCQDRFVFGRDGKPLYIQHPDDPPELVEERMATPGPLDEAGRAHRIVEVSLDELDEETRAEILSRSEAAK